MRAFHNDPELKKKFLLRVKMHREADELIHGTGWENGKGCAIGCTLEKYDHAAYEIELGIPRIIARIEDRIFEGLRNGDAQAWPEQFLEAIQPGADLSMVWYRFQRRLLADSERGTMRLCNAGGRDATLTIISLFDRHISGGVPTADQWITGRRDAADAAYAADAAAYAADAAAYAAAAYAAYAAADAAYDAAAYAAYAAADAAYDAAYAAYDAAYAADDAAYAADAAAYAAAYAREKHYQWMRDILLEELAAAPILEAA